MSSLFVLVLLSCVQDYYHVVFSIGWLFFTNTRDRFHTVNYSYTISTGRSHLCGPSKARAGGRVDNPFCIITLFESPILYSIQMIVDTICNGHVCIFKNKDWNRIQTFGDQCSFITAAEEFQNN